MKVDLPFVPPADGARRMASVKGTLTATLPGRIETFKFADLSSATRVERRIAAVTVMLEQVRRASRRDAPDKPAAKDATENWEVHLRVRFDDAGDALESHRTWVFDNPACLQSAAGETIAPAGYETTAQSDNEVGAGVFLRRESADRPLYVCL